MRSRRRCWPGWSPATASTDTTPPTSTITSPARRRDHRGRRQVTRSPARRPTPAAASSPASRSPPTAAPPGTRASGHDRAGPTRWVAHGNPTRDDRVARGRRQRQPRDPVRRDHGQRQLPLLDLGHRRDPGHARLRRRHRRSRSGSSSPRTPSASSPASGSTRRRRTPAPTSATCGPRAGQLLASADVHRRDRVRLAAGQLLKPGADQPEHDLRGVLLRPRRATTADDEATSTRRPPRARHGTASSTARRCTRCATPARHGNGVFSLQRTSTVPDRAPSTPRTTGSTSIFTPPATAPGQVTNVDRDAGLRLGIAELDSADDGGGPVTSYTITPYIGATAADADTDDRHPRRRRARRSPG